MSEIEALAERVRTSKLAKEQAGVAYDTAKAEYDVARQAFTDADMEYQRAQAELLRAAGGDADLYYWRLGMTESPNDGGSAVMLTSYGIGK